jgi:hypothetical protein
MFNAEGFTSLFDIGRSVFDIKINLKSLIYIRISTKVAKSLRSVIE